MIDEFREWIVETGVVKFLLNTKDNKNKKYIEDRYPKFKNDLFSEFQMKKPKVSDKICIKDIIKNNVFNQYKIIDSKAIKEGENCFLPMTKLYSVRIQKAGIKKIKTEEDINDLFYTQLTYRESFDFNIKITNDDLYNYFPKSKELTDEEKFNLIINKLSQNPQLNTNYLFLLTGEIGSGKTTYLSKLLYELNTISFSFCTRIGIRIDFEDFALNLITESKRSDLSLDEYVNIHIIDMVEKEIDFFVNKLNLPDKSKLFICLCIDNLDVIYQKFCETYFIQPQGHTFIEIFKGMIKKLKDFKYRNNNIIIISALREESIEALKKRKVGEENFLEEYFSAHLNINDLNSTKTKKIIKKRLLLMQKIAVKNKSIDKSLIENIENNIKSFDETKINFDDIQNISTEGLRNTIDLFYRISHALYCKTLFKRFFIDDYYIRKMHFLGDSFDYSQVEKGIFNIFLNNRLYRESLCHSANHEIYQYKTKEVEKMASINHFQTYWLKYFILFYLYCDKKDELTKEPTLNQLISIFTRKGSSNKYEENLVRLVLLGLSEVSHGRLLGIKLKDDDMIDTFYLTDRANYLLENVVWSFSYLTVVLEDTWLQFPKFIAKKCKYMFEPMRKHCHEINEEKFKINRIENFKLLIRKVLFFIKILEISYTYEILKVKNVFEVLRENNNDLIKTTDVKFLLPNFHSIRINLKKEIITRASILGINYINQKYLNDIRFSDTYPNQVIEEELESFFKDNYCVNTDNDKEVLKKYFSDNEKEYDSIFQNKI